jgi:hypothetical protein
MAGPTRGCPYLMIPEVCWAPTRVILTSIILVMFIFCEMLPLCAQTRLHTDRSGYITGTVGRNSVNIYRDRHGNTRGSVGSERMSTYSDRYGGTAGMVSKKAIISHDDGYGSTTGIIGKDRINLYTDRLGNTTGPIGRRTVICYADRFGNTTCNQERSGAPLLPCELVITLKAALL